MTEEPTRKSRSIDEVMADIEAISKDSEHRDQFKALRMLASAQSSSVTLPPPMEDHDIIERLARLMKPSGFRLTQIAYKVAFPNRKAIEEVEPTIAPSHLSDEDRVTIQHCTTVKALHRLFPEIKKAGLHPGYPRGKGREVVQKWCRDQATKILVDRAQARMKAAEARDVGLSASTEVVPTASLDG